MFYDYEEGHKPKLFGQPIKLLYALNVLMGLQLQYRVREQKSFSFKAKFSLIIILITKQLWIHNKSYRTEKPWQF